MKHNEILNIECEDTGEFASTYSDYLQTIHWKGLRLQVAKRENHTCQRCHKEHFEPFSIHHVTYSTLGKNSIADLMFYCAPCHAFIHNKDKDKSYLQKGRGNTLIIKNSKEDPYLISKRIMQDIRLSWKARGLMGYLLTLTENSIFNTAELEKLSARDGRDSLTNGIKELLECGYIDRQRNRTNKGSFSGWSYIVYDSPQLYTQKEIG